MMSTAYRVDIDGTIAEPRFFDDDLGVCCRWYVHAGIVQPEEIQSIRYHQQLFLLPQVLLTHVPIAGAIESLQAIVSQGKTLQYFTVRQNFDSAICAHVHQNTRDWLENHRFPFPSSVHFFWDAADKLLQSLVAPEEQIILIDDRPTGLVKAYQRIAQQDPPKAQQIQERVHVLALGTTEVSNDSTLNVTPLPTWSSFCGLFLT